MPFVRNPPITNGFLTQRASNMEGVSILRRFNERYMPAARGRGRGPAGFDAPFNMGSAKGEIEWNSIFQGKYLMDYIN